MEVKFLRDYRGRETKENFVQEGGTWDINPKEIRHLVNEEVIEKSALLQAPPEKFKSPGKKKDESQEELPVVSTDEQQPIESTDDAGTDPQPTEPAAVE